MGLEPYAFLPCLDALEARTAKLASRSLSSGPEPSYASDRRLNWYSRSCWIGKACSQISASPMRPGEISTKPRAMRFSCILTYLPQATPTVQMSTLKQDGGRNLLYLELLWILTSIL